MITELELSNTCYCKNEDGTPSECWGCYDDNRAFIEERLDSWINREDIGALLIHGAGMGWTRAKKSFAISAGGETIIDALTITREYRLVFMFDDADNLTVMRYSHDEPTGATFEITPANRCDNCVVVPCECEEEDED